MCKTKSGKYQGQVRNKLKRVASGGVKIEYTKQFVNRAYALEAAKALQKRLDKKYEDTTAKWAEADPLTRGLPLGPEDAAKAEVDKAYWQPNEQKGHKPYRVVRVNAGKK